MTFTRNGITIEMPKGCPGIQAHLATLQINLGICGRLPHMAHLIPGIRANIEQVRKALAGS